MNPTEEFFDDLRQEYSIDPAFARLRGTTEPVWFRHSGLVEKPDVLFVAAKPDLLVNRLHVQMVTKAGMVGLTGVTFLYKFPAYMNGKEKHASEEYAKREVAFLQPKVLVALGNEALAFCLRWEDKDKIPPVSVCHGQRFATPRGKPVIAGLPPTIAFHEKRIWLAYEAAAYALKSLEEVEFVG